MGIQSTFARNRQNNKEKAARGERRFRRRLKPNCPQLWYTKLIARGAREADETKANGGQGQRGLAGRATSVSATCFGGVLLSPRSCQSRSVDASQFSTNIPSMSDLTRGEKHLLARTRHLLYTAPVNTKDTAELPTAELSLAYIGTDSSTAKRVAHDHRSSRFRLGDKKEAAGACRGRGPCRVLIHIYTYGISIAFS